MSRRSERRVRTDDRRPFERASIAGIVLVGVVGVALVPISVVPTLARASSGALVDLGIASSRSSLSEFTGDLPVGLPSEASVGVEGTFTGVPALPHVIQADPVALDLIGYGPVQMTAPALRAITGARTSIGTLADQATISSSSINPVIQGLFASRPPAGPAAESTGSASSRPLSGSNPSLRSGPPPTAYIATSVAPTTGMDMVCPAGEHAVVGGGSSQAPGATLVSSSGTDATGAALGSARTDSGWTITFSASGMVTLWVICHS